VCSRLFWKSGNSETVLQWDRGMVHLSHLPGLATFAFI